MVIELPTTLQAALAASAARRGVPPEALVLDVLRREFMPQTPPAPGNEWERRLFSAAVETGVSVPDAALSSDGLYE